MYFCTCLFRKIVFVFIKTVMKRYFLVLLCLVLSSFSIISLAVTKKEAQTLVENQQYEEAIDALRSLMKQSAYAKDGDCNKLLGQSLCMTGRYKEALKPLETAIKLNRRSGAQWYLAITRQHLYDFEGALGAIEAYRPVLKSDSWIERADSLEAECQQGLRALNHIEDVEIIDSLFVYKPSFFSYYKLGPESGRFMNNDQYGIFFENQAADYRIFAADGTLYESYKIRDNWEETHPLKGVGSEDFKVITPFMRTDGETLYFACDSTPGIGGLDIYKTRFNSEEGSYYQPERLGMPFNSPFDDYMMAIDESHQVGWWATDRGDDPEHVLIYIFKLNGNPEYLDEPSVERARVDRIADSWKQEDGYEDLMSSILQADDQMPQSEKIYAVIDNQKVYTSLDQFRNSEARKWFEQNQQTKQLIADNEKQLENLRKEYSSASKSQKQNIAAQIHRVEEELYSFYRQLAQVEKKYRSLELQ